jgi:hypothetical protein
VLRDIELADICPDQPASCLAGVQGALDPAPVPLDCEGNLAELRAICDEFPGKSKNNKFVLHHNEVTCRASILVCQSEKIKRMSHNRMAMQ